MNPNRTSFIGTFTPLSYLAFKCMFLLQRTRNRLIYKTRKKIQQQRSNQIEMNKLHTAHAMMSNSISYGATPIDLANSSPIVSEANPSFINSNELIITETISRPRPTSVVTANGDSETQSAPSTARKTAAKHATPKSNKKFLLDPNHSKATNMIVNGVLICVSFIFICFGCIFIFFTFSHFEQSHLICSNPSDWLMVNHPELNVWDECIFQVFPFSISNSRYDGSYPCNCRHAKVNLTSFSANDDTNVSMIVESMLKSWDMLEIVVINDDTSHRLNIRFGVNLTHNYHYNSKYLKILHLDNIELRNFGDGIKNWQDLEYIHASHAHIKSWPNGFNQLNKLRYLKLWDVLYLDDLPPNLCQMHDLRALNIFQSIAGDHKIKTLPECIVNLYELQSLVFYAVLIKTLPVKLFKMPNIQEIAFLFSNISYISFKTIDTLNMHWNPTSQTSYYFTGSPLCLPKSEFNYSQFSDPLIEFMDDVDPCVHVCRYTDQDTILNLQCTPLDWQNGICDTECNHKDCSYDGGDCNQLCEAHSPNCSIASMFGNGICDPECNNTFCSFDVGECIYNEYRSINVSQVFGNNATYCDSHANAGLCEIVWIGDGWCDDNCRYSESCFYDANDCNCDSSDNYCREWFSSFSQTFADTISDDGDYYMSLNGFCDIWIMIPTFVKDEFVEEYIEPYNCSTAFSMIDIDNSGYIDFYEFIYVLNVYEVIEGVEITDAKYQQINCSMCFDDT